MTVLCSRCGYPASIEQKYSGLDLCSKCFEKQVEKRFSRAVREYDLINARETIGVAISGGKDSAALLYLLHDLSKKMPFTIIPIIIDEGIEHYRKYGIEKAKLLCDSLNLPLQVYSYKDEYKLSMDEIVEKKKDLGELRVSGNCSYCGVFRKQLLNKAARELNCDKLALGHNLDDMAQTYLMNVMRNEPQRLNKFGLIIESSLEGFVSRIKPLAYIPEKETTLYCFAKKLPFHLGECPHSSEAFRGEIKDFLNSLEVKHSGVKFNIVKSFSNLKSVDDKVYENKKCFECGEITSQLICKACLYKKEINEGISAN